MRILECLICIRYSLQPFIFQLWLRVHVCSSEYHIQSICLHLYECSIEFCAPQINGKTLLGRAFAKAEEVFNGQQIANAKLSIVILRCVCSLKMKFITHSQML